MRSMAVRAVIFDWGGTLTPWHSIDLRALWADACTPHFPAGQVASVAAVLHAAESALWRQAVTVHHSATIEHVFARDSLLGLIDGAVYTSEIPWTKPHPGAFRAAMAAVGEDDPQACVFVGD